MTAIKPLAAGAGRNTKESAENTIVPAGSRSKAKKARDRRKKKHAGRSNARALPNSLPIHSKPVEMARANISLPNLQIRLKVKTKKEGRAPHQFKKMREQYNVLEYQVDLMTRQLFGVRLDDGEPDLGVSDDILDIVLCNMAMEVAALGEKIKAAGDSDAGNELSA